MVSRAKKTNPNPKPTKKPTKSLNKRTCKAPTKKSKPLRGNKRSLGWPDLPFDLFKDISSRLPLKSRYILGFVDTTWSGFVSTLLPPIKPKLSSPWYLSQLNNSSNFLCHHVETELSFSFGPYPDIEGKTCVGSQDGWLILANDKLRVSFFNPFSESHVTFPRLHTTIAHCPANLSSVEKVVFVSHPQSPDFVAAVVFTNNGRLTFALWEARRGYWNLFSNDPRCAIWAGKIHDIF